MGEIKRGYPIGGGLRFYDGEEPFFYPGGFSTSTYKERADDDTIKRARMKAFERFTPPSEPTYLNRRWAWWKCGGESIWDISGNIVKRFSLLKQLKSVNHLKEFNNLPKEVLEAIHPPYIGSQRQCYLEGTRISFRVDLFFRSFAQYTWRDIRGGIREGFNAADEELCAIVDRYAGETSLNPFFPEYSSSHHYSPVVNGEYFRGRS